MELLKYINRFIKKQKVYCKNCKHGRELFKYICFHPNNKEDISCHWSENKSELEKTVYFIKYRSNALRRNGDNNCKYYEEIN